MYEILVKLIFFLLANEIWLNLLLKLPDNSDVRSDSELVIVR